MITIIGLGAGDMDQLPLGIYNLLKTADHLYLRTKDHPVVAVLEKEGITFTAFDKIYESHNTFEEVYEEITKKLIQKSKENHIVYAVPGHPMVAERVVQQLISADVPLAIKGGQSFLDALFTSLKIDPIEGFQLLDATSFDPSDLTLQHHVVFCQVYDGFTASNIKLPLLDILPYDYQVFIVTGAGSAGEVIKKVDLYELDFQLDFNDLTSVYIPPVAKELLNHEFSYLRQTVATLRGPAGCPWDKSQTHQSLKKYLIEETQELLVALDSEDDDHIIEELGDVMLQVVLHAQLAEEAGYFNIADVIRVLNEKLVRRHPHVFGDKKAKNPEEAIAIWQQMKEKEKAEQNDE